MMTLPQIISRNQIQKTNKRVISLVNVVIQPNTYYTCPTGKIAIVRGTCTCVDFGAAANASLEFDDVKYATWLVGGGTIVDQLTNLSNDMTITFKCELSAGDTIKSTQNTGTNAQFKFQAEIEEFNI